MTLLNLSSSQQQKFYTLKPVYGTTAAINIVANLSDKGKNGYSAFLDKMDAVTKATYEVEAYYDAVYDEFQLNQQVTPGDIILKIAETRRKLELEPYRDKIKLRSESDFFLLFVYKEVRSPRTDESGVTKNELVGYIPLARVKPNPEDID